jgi:pilus assembly protein Flp/PilA
MVGDDQSGGADNRITAKPRQHLYPEENNMSKALNLIKNLAKDEEGTALVEYSILLGVIAVAVIGLATAVGAWSGTQWTNLCAKLVGAVCP